MKDARRKCTTATSGGSRRQSFSPSVISRIGAKHREVLLPAHLVADTRATVVRTCPRGDDAADTSVADSESTGQHLPCAWSQTTDATAEKKQPDMSDIPAFGGTCSRQFAMASEDITITKKQQKRTTSSVGSVDKCSQSHQRLRGHGPPT